jgi:aspartyl-tRNA(Asn)/glutamyl-tRNA(Gln) amidotransferase subunit B
VWCPQKRYLSHPPDFSGLDPDTGEPWSPLKVVEILGMVAFDPSKLDEVCREILAQHPDEVESFRKGKMKVMGKLIKAVLDVTSNGADARKAKETLENLLQS